MIVVPFAAALLAGLPIREQPRIPPETGVEPPEIVFWAVLLAGLLIAAVLVGVRRSRRSRGLALDEEQARMSMTQLCRHGWRAQLTLYGSQELLPDDAPDVEGIRVRLDWHELAGGESPDERDVAVARRLWSRTIPGALRAMVEDRRLDHELEEIERAQIGRGGADARE